MPPKTTLPTSFLYAVEQNRRKGRNNPAKTAATPEFKFAPVDNLLPQAPNKTQGVAGMPSAMPTSFLAAVEKNRTGVAPTAAKSSVATTSPGQPTAPRADRGLALLDQMQNDRAAGVPVGASSALSGPGSTRKLESDAGKAERLARRYMKKFGGYGASAAGGLLETATAERMGTPGVRSEAYRKADEATEAEAQGVAAQTTAAEKAELQDRTRRIEQGRTGKAGRGTPIKKKAQP